MTKELALETMMLLSALESWGFSNNQRIPDYILEDIDKVQEQMKAIVLDAPAKQIPLYPDGKGF